MRGVNVYLPPPLQKEVEAYQAAHSLETLSQATRRLVRIGLERAVKEKGIEVAV